MSGIPPDYPLLIRYYALRVPTRGGSDAIRSTKSARSSRCSLEHQLSGRPHDDRLRRDQTQCAPQSTLVSSPRRSGGPPALALDRKKLAAFSAAAGRFLRFPIGDRRGTRMRASASKRPVTRAQALTNATLAAAGLLHRRSPTAPCLERCIGRPPKKVGRIFGPRRGLRLPAWPRLGHNFANDLAVSIDERHSPLRFIAAERLRGRVKRRARDVVHHSMIPLRPPHRWVIGPPLTIIGEVSSFGCSNAGGARRLSTPHTTLA